MNAIISSYTHTHVRTTKWAADICTKWCITWTKWNL